ncbi:YveK family protein [uncultured Ruminococcus sp.]|uniref:YveK family protein n=1 Tax=uncultured Ruminococcus sp. TaxID=165186 RepID=UPI0025F67A68|nr:Wzz/FepE/Etk N-terminal domain-containing protein [uncultured Ruminococcus sp.]
MEISFNDILRIIKKNLIFILIVSLIFAVCSFFVTKFFIKKTYTSTVKLYVSTDYNGASSGYQDLNAYNYSSKLVSTYIELLDTNNFYGNVSKSLNSKYTATELESMIKFTRVEETEVFKADITSGNPAEAKSIADAVAKTAPGTVKELLSNNSTLKVVDEATTPKNPTSPNVAKNVIIALLIGIIISLIIAFIRDYFDVKIKYDDEMTTIANLPVLAAIPDFEYFAKSINSNSSK